jgi:4-diphosphocytidyl-2-C-methyl-D-erythritol kinase
MLKISTPAKVNLVLEVLGCRRDGYHEVRTILQTIGLYDHLVIGHGSDIGFKCQPQTLENPDNLVWRAAQILRKRLGGKEGAIIFLEKNIPESFGLGGGSSDAAATLLALCRIWDIHPADNSLMELAASLGSDVPFFIKGGLAAAQGRGEQILNMPRRVAGWVTVVLPTVDIPKMKTRHAYQMLQHVNYTDGKIFTKVMKKLEDGNGIDSSDIYNVFEAVSERLYPGIVKIRTSLEHACGCQFHMAGSGPALFSLCSSRSEAQSKALLIQDKGFVCKICAFSRGPRLLNDHGQA